MKHFFSSRIRTVIIAAVLLAVVLAVVANLSGLKLPDMAVQTVLTPIRSVFTSITDKAQQLYNYVFNYETLEAENEALKEELAQIRENNLQSDSIARENERLRSLLGLKEANEDYVLVDSYIIGTDSVDWTSTFTINRGKNADLEPGMCAVTANGELVGIISEVGPNYSIVKSVMDSSLDISATIASSGYNGMVRGGYSSGLNGLLRMDYLPSSATIRNNDQVVTTGSTIYPRNLIIGYVVDAGFDDTGVAKFALLAPAAPIRTLEQVFIITQYDAG